MKEAAIIGVNLSLGYTKQKSKKEILNGLNFSLYAGEMTCLLGPNGVGKSTLIKAILGQLKPFQGDILLNGKSISNFSNQALAKELSVVLTEPFLPGNMTVGQLVSMGRIPHTSWTGKLSEADLQAVSEAMEATKITYLKDERLGEISDGQRQKAMIARALAQDGKVMILDEPTAHLDLVNRFEIMRLLHEISKKQQKAVLVVTHDLEIALETADKFWLLNCGLPMISGLPEDLVISGEINQLLPGDKFQFSLARGRIELTTMVFDFDVSGTPDLVQWVKNALQKSGVISLGSKIQVSGNPLLITYEGRGYKSVGEFVEDLKSKV
jgi:iron complex transport system ATP-binding protein